MHDQRTPVEQDRQTDYTILMMLVDEPGLWTPDEIALELQGDAVKAADGVSRLFAAGLIYRLDGFVMATRAALRGQRLAL